ncbi:toxin glutamine deamidase domain-containing protein [Streptomyces sp. NPDC101152]|uniref:toxin glutamine deamidase domain-containing protein n=1 Tax=Streptomyces sp. NPDC101152 TaxID=3366116 RepID=UPI003809E6CD
MRDIGAGGDGARGIVWGFSPNGASHVFNVINVGGDVIFLDGQSGHANPRGLSWSSRLCRGFTACVALTATL